MLTFMPGLIACHDRPTSDCNGLLIFSRIVASIQSRHRDASWAVQVMLQQWRRATCTDLLRQPVTDKIKGFRKFAGCTMASTWHQVDFGMASAFKNQSVCLWYKNVVRAIDDNHRAVIIAVKQGAPREKTNGGRKFIQCWFIVKSHVVADDAGHTVGQALQIFP